MRQLKQIVMAVVSIAFVSASYTAPAYAGVDGASCVAANAPKSLAAFADVAKQIVKDKLKRGGGSGNILDQISNTSKDVARVQKTLCRKEESSRVACLKAKQRLKINTAKGDLDKAKDELRALGRDKKDTEEYTAAEAKVTQEKAKVTTLKTELKNIRRSAVCG